MYYGFLILFIGALGLFFSGPGQTYSNSIFIDYYIKNFGWSRTEVSSIYSMATLSAGLIIPIIGKNVDKLGHRKMFTLVSTFLGLTCLGMTKVTSIWMLFIGFFFLRMLGQGSMTLLPTTLIPKWFIKKRGLALSIMGLGGVISSSLVPTINNSIIMKKGINSAWIFWSISLLFVMAPISYFLIRNKPSDMGLLPDGSIDNKDTSYKKNKHISEYDWTIKETIRTRAFWLMLFSVMIPSMINTGLTFHMVSIMNLKGHNSTFAASILGLSALVQLPFTFIAGFLLDKISVHYLKSVNFIFYFLITFMFLMVDNPKYLLIYAVFQGIFLAFDSISSGVLWSNYYGIEHLGSIRGLATMAMVIGSALGPLPFGYAYDIFGGYTQIISIILIFPIMGAAFTYLSPRPIKK